VVQSEGEMDGREATNDNAKGRSFAVMAARVAARNSVAFFTEVGLDLQRLQCCLNSLRCCSFFTRSCVYTGQRFSWQRTLPQTLVTGGGKALAAPPPKPAAVSTARLPSS
jgi:hypothetical protein